MSSSPIIETLLVISDSRPGACPLAGKVQLVLKKALKNPSITLKLVARSNANFDDKIHSKVFFSQSFLILTSKKLETNNKNSDIFNRQGGCVEIPFDIIFPPNRILLLPLFIKTDLPPSFVDTLGAIQYELLLEIKYLSCFTRSSKLYQNSFPISIHQPNQLKLFLKSKDSPLAYNLPICPDKCDLKLHLDKRVIEIGIDCVIANISIARIPIGSALRHVNVSLRSFYELKGDKGISKIVNFPRPLSEMRYLIQENKNPINLSTPLLWSKRISLKCDEKKSKITIVSPLFTIKTVFRLEVVLDTSPSPNIILEIPITLVDSCEDEFHEDTTITSDGDTTLTDSRKVSFEMDKTVGLKINTSPSSIGSSSIPSLSFPTSSPQTSPDTPDLYDILEEDYIKPERYVRNRRPSNAEEKLDLLMSQIVDLQTNKNISTLPNWFEPQKTLQIKRSTSCKSSRSMDDSVSNPIPAILAAEPIDNLQEEDDQIINWKHNPLTPNNSIHKVVVGERRRGRPHSLLDFYLTQPVSKSNQHQLKVNDDVSMMMEPIKKDANATDTEKYRALYAYKPACDDEIELMLGDIILSRKKFQDNWGVGLNTATMMEGMVPFSLCEKM